MALQTPTITVVSVVETSTLRFSITLRLVVVDTDGIGIDKTYSERYRSGDAISDKVTIFRNVMQADIAKYKREKALLGAAAALTTAINNIKAGLVI